MRTINASLSILSEIHSGDFNELSLSLSVSLCLCLSLSLSLPLFLSPSLSEMKSVHKVLQPVITENTKTCVEVVKQ